MHGGFFDFDALEKEIERLARLTGEKGFWDNPKKATVITQKLAALQKNRDEWNGVTQDVIALAEIAEMDKADHEVNMQVELEKQFQELKKRFEVLEYHLMFCEKYDQHDAVMAIHAGSGGTDAQDWTEILLRMYLRYAEKHGFEADILALSAGNEAGIKKVVLEIRGENAYGSLKSESGVHRLVRISPFDAEKMRHTSYALVEILPELGELEEIVIQPEDLKIDVFRAGGHGGQSVNTTDSAVRITHIPTKITVVCQNERSQLRNKEHALKYLKAKLHSYYETEREEEKQQLRGEFSEIAWGNQARSYVLHPYKMVKDHRTKHETTDVDRVLDGEIDEFIESFLRMKVEERNQNKPDNP